MRQLWWGGGLTGVYPRGLEAIRIQKYFKYITNNDR